MNDLKTDTMGSSGSSAAFPRSTNTEIDEALAITSIPYIGVDILIRNYTELQKK